VAVHLLLLATSEAAQPRSRSARPPQSRSAEPCIAKDGESSSWHDSSSSSSWWSNSRAHTRFNRVRLRKDFDNVGPHEADTLPMRGGQLKANNAAMFKTKFQVTQNRLVVLVFLFCGLRVYTPVKLLQANLRLHSRQEQKRLQGQSTADTAQYFHHTMALW
jgi:hypothetical protein